MHSPDPTGREREPFELFEVPRAQRAQTAATERCEPQPHHSVICVIGPTPHEPGVFGAIDETNHAVVSQHQRLGDLTDGRTGRRATPPNREQQLVLSRREAGRDGLFLTPVQEATQASTELEQALVLAVANVAIHAIYRNTMELR
jgi:hypothetical protein